VPASATSTLSCLVISDVQMLEIYLLIQWLHCRLGFHSIIY